jgi:hypothetical protein
MLVGFSSCSKDEEDENLPEVQTVQVWDVNYISAKIDGKITDDKGFKITAKGFVYSNQPDPDLNSKYTNAGNGTEAFTNTITNLSPSTKYYVKAYATSESGTSYGKELEFTTTTK